MKVLILNKLTKTTHIYNTTMEVPFNVNYIAVDGDGEIRGFEEEPTLTGGHFGSNAYWTAYTHDAYEISIGQMDIDPSDVVNSLRDLNNI